MFQNNLTHADWQEERSGLSTIPLGSSQFEGQRSLDVEPRRLHHREAIVNWVGQDHQTPMPDHSHANSGVKVSGEQDKRKRKLDTPHEAPGPSERVYIVHPATSPRNQRSKD
ncbi:hypothetical protein P691DRAFT_482127 [Macrolepiota fuliginosa MF-IS2]|uniref:Uncharacterized protein n=1 Tax=Macrolepiota fuliginosa MF-IS2 TaxID=1400762 RepID=A0A9P5XGF5_9AGAR|nr:hypothetical protein P691DRAFT_482127 [Macrolepiota fuliginosa MF-IS2]